MDFIEFFAVDDGVALLEAELESAGGARLPTLLALAWQLRQRDTRRSLALADAAQALLDAQGGADGAEDAGLRQARLRLMLVRGEAEWLLGDPTVASGLAQAALRECDGLDDLRGRADTHWLLSMLATARGDMAATDAEMAAVSSLAERAGDPVRAMVADVGRAVYLLYSDVGAARHQWGARIAGGKTGLHPAAGSLVEWFLGNEAHQCGDFSGVVRHCAECHALALACGHNRLAIFAATYIASNLNKLNEFNGALEWAQRGLALARAMGWPSLLGVALMETAQTLRHLQRREAARAMLAEALALLGPHGGSRSYAIALGHMGDAELDCGQPAAALGSFLALAERADALSQPELQSASRRGQALALLRLGRPEQALAAAEAALAFAADVPERQIAALRVMAEIHAGHPLPAPPGMAAASVPLHYLHQALALASSIDGYIVPAELLQALAAACAAMGDHGQAYRFACRAIAAREQTHSQGATNRATALQVAHQAERDRAESEHHRRLAAAESKRADALQKMVELQAAAHRELEAAHQRLKETQQQLMLQEKMAGLGTLTAGVAHEINNPANFAHVGAQNMGAGLAEFRQFFHDLVGEDEDPETVAQFTRHFDRLEGQAATILNGTTRIRAIVKDLRTFTRLDQDQKQPVRLSACLESTLNLVRTSWLEHVEFTTEFADDPVYECWPALLNQVFMNLLVNACQACAAKRRIGHGGGPVLGRVRVTLKRCGGAIEIGFSDTGVGMSSALQARILEPFFTTKAVGEGTGLGLSISYGIVQKHGGDLRIDSVEGEGSRFTLVLPLAPGVAGDGG